MKSPKVAVTLSIVIVNWNTCALLAQCLASIYANVSGTDFEVIVVDNASQDDSVTMVKRDFPQVRLIENDENVGFTRANNQAMAVSGGRYILLLNSDAVVLSGASEGLLALAESHPQAGLVGAQLLNPDGTFQASYTDFPTLWREFLILSGLGRLLYSPHYPSHGPEEGRGPRQVDYVEGACLLVRRQVFQEMGGFDEDFFMYAEEVDWCYRMRQAGWEVWYAPQVRIVHHGGASSRKKRTSAEAQLYRSRVMFFRKHYGPRPAEVLRGMIMGLTLLKRCWHELLRWASGGRRGRPVVAWGELRAALERC